MRTLMFFTFWLVSLSAVAAPTINVNTLTGKIFFIGYRETNEFKGRGDVRQLYVINANGTGEQSLLPEFKSIWSLASYPGLKKLSFKSNTGGSSRNGQFVLNISEPWRADELESRLARMLPESFPVKYQDSYVKGSNYSIAFSPDGRLVAGYLGSLHIADVNTGAVIKIENQLMTESLPVWSPDGSKIVFMGPMFGDRFSNEFELFLVDKDGKNLHQLTNLPRPKSWWSKFLETPARRRPYDEGHHSNSPRWSPDGQWIVFVNYDDIYKIRPDGKDLTLLVKNAAYPTWSPDGKMIAYAAFRPDIPPLTKEEAPDNVGDRSPNIYVSWADGTGETRITNNRRKFGYFDLNWME